MKKNIALSLLLVMTVIFVFPLCTFCADGIIEKYTVTESGIVAAYSGDEYAFVPSKIGDTNIVGIGESLFESCGVKNVYIDDDITQIGKYAFRSSGAEYINLGKDIKEIGAEAFSGCKALKTIVFNGDVPEFGADMLHGTNYIEVVIPCTSNTLNWVNAILSAKGNDNFKIVKNHNMVNLGNEMKYDDSPLAHCTICGYKESPLPEISVPFIDVFGDDWYYECVSKAYEINILNGKSDKFFDPMSNMTLAEAAKIAACIYAYQHNDVLDFSSSSGNWYDPYVNYCKITGIIDPEDNFDWEKNATRGEMAYFFAKADVEKHEVNTGFSLSDIPDVDQNTPYNDSILALYRRGIASGNDEKYTFAPNDDVLRCEASAFIARILFYEMRKDLA